MSIPRPAEAPSGVQTLMGAEVGQLNLRGVQTRAAELHKTIDSLIQILQFAPASLQWSDALDKFAVINVQLQHLHTQLRPVLQHYAVHPKSVNQSNAPVLPIMLATKLLPEQEEERAELLAAGAAAGGGTAAAAEAAAALNAAVDALAAAGGLLDPKGKRRKEMAAEVKAASDPAAAAADAAAAGAALAGAQRRAAGGAPAAPLEGGALLIAAACYGAGLTL